MVALLGAAAAKPMMAQSPLKFRGLDHIEFTVKDVERSTAFYAQLFGGADVMKNRTTTRRYIKLGTSYMAIDKADTPRIDHVCLGVENFNIDAAHAYLTAQNLTYRDYPSGRDTGVNDPDGTRLQLSSEKGWSALAAQTASPEPRRNTPLLQPLELAEVEIYVSDLVTASPHYDKLLGRSKGGDYPVGRAHLSLSKGSSGYHRFIVRTRNFDAVALSRKLPEMGAQLEPDAPGWGVAFLDPDGFRVAVRGSDNVTLE
jgi:catechol 2,3-dioxygenase-like lactoylglutathione lyase family enzyme